MEIDYDDIDDPIYDYAVALCEALGIGGLI